MSAVEETKSNLSVPQPAAAGPRVVMWVLDLLSSVRFGVVLLVLLVVASMIGMLVMQVNVEGFDAYYAAMTPASRFLLGKLGFFDIYHAWYFNALLLVLSLNIVLASIDRFPSAWSYVRKKKLDASAHWLRGQEQSANLRFGGADRGELAAKVSEAFRAVRLKPTVTEKGGKTFVFGERGAWNRLGAYAVHVALLTIFTGGFLTSQFGRVGNMPLEPGQRADTMTETVFDLDRPSRVVYDLPFTVECLDVQQKLIRKEGTITADNTLDWLTRIRISDKWGQREALVHMNKPHDYRGYRFFQASFIPEGKARQITVRAAPEGGGAPAEVTIPRGGSVALPDGTRIDFKDFAANFSLGGAAQGDPSVYNNPAATLAVTPPGGRPARAFAFPPAVADNAPFAKQPVGGYTFRLLDFEKVPKAHVLSVQKDPGSAAVYVGFALLALTLSAVFFFSHDRVWASIEERAEGVCEVVLGGNTNRNKLAFGDRFRRLAERVGGEPFEVKGK